MPNTKTAGNRAARSSPKLPATKTAPTRLTADIIKTLATPAKGQAYYFDAEQTGFGVVVGHTGVRSFIVTGRVRGTKGGDGKDVKRRITIGVVGSQREADGHDWTLRLARDEAKRLLGDMAQGKDPNATRRKRATSNVDGPTLRKAMETHLAKMRKKRRAQRSIETLEWEMELHLAKWLDRPIAELTGEVLVGIHDSIKANATPRRNANPLNETGAPLANRVVAHVSACWRSLNKQMGGKLGGWNPASSVDKDTLRPKRQVIADEDLPDYVARVATMRSPIRRDGLTFALYTGLRHEDVREVRLDEVDWEECTLRRPDPKGGEGRAFTLPLSKVPLEILKRRERDNARDLGADPGGWAFPGIASDGSVGPIDNLRQQLGKSTTRFPVEDVHTLRRTWASIADAENVSELDQHVLSNHAFAGHNVNAIYIKQHMSHLAACAKKIDDGVTRRIKSSPTKAKRGKLRLVAE